jgi:hypothetical protein
MTLVLQLPPETEAKLRDRAQLAGIAPEALALETLREGLGDDGLSAPALSTEAWLAEFDAWIAGLKPGNPNLDDSRDSIYPDRW